MAMAVLVLLLVIATLIFASAYLQYFSSYIAEILTSIIAIGAVSLVGYLHLERRKLKAYYEVVWKKSSSLKPIEVLGPFRAVSNHGFHEYYYQRPVDRLIKKRIEDNTNVLVTGNPLAGKSRAIYQALLTLDGPRDVIIPRLREINLEDFRVPRHLSFWRRCILVIDDLDKFVEQQNFLYLLREFSRKNATIVASCRSGPEYEVVCNKLEADLSTLFSDPIEIHKLTKDEGEKIAEKTGRSLPSRFDGNVGSIFLELDTMKERFKRSSEEEQAILEAVRCLFDAGVYREREIFSIRRIERVCKQREGIEVKPYQWERLFSGLEGKGLIKMLGKEEVAVEEVYLGFVKKEYESPLTNLIQLMKLFSRDPEVLLSLGTQACRIGTYDIDIVNYMKVATKAYGKASNFLKKYPVQYASAQNNLGNALGTLARVKQKAENCRKAISAYHEALGVFNIGHFPIDYAAIQSNLGGVYGLLAEVEDSSENCKKAIIAYDEALKVYTLDRFPMSYAVTQNNLGNVLITLAKVEGRVENCRKAIDACDRALKVLTLERFPVLYAMAQNNLGIAYRTLAFAECKVENCRKAIKAYGKALRVYMLERFPMQYAMTQNNLGNAYRTLAEAQGKVENCWKAIFALGKAIGVYSLDLFPLQYAMVQTNLGDAYTTLAEEEDSAENCKKAIIAYGEALRVRTLENFPMLYATTQNSLGNAYGLLAGVEDKAENCRKAIIAYGEALRVYTKKDFPEVYASLEVNLERTISFCEDYSR
jgi:tetratricopeptide (TPR) repeat protein/general stress protein CsbA